MEIGSVTALISSVGFPIVCCLACFWYIKKMNEEHKADTQTLVEKFTETYKSEAELHKAENEKLAEAIRDNTQVMTKLIEKIEKG